MLPRPPSSTLFPYTTLFRSILDTTAELAAEHGLLSVTMSQIAERTGIGRATLYKYFPDVQAILHAWHERQIAAHLAQLRSEEHTSEPVTRPSRMPSSA